MQDPVTILHLSDIQFGKNHRFGTLATDAAGEDNFNTLLQRLLDDLNSLRTDHGVKPNVIIVSGDLAETGAKKELEDAFSLIRALTNHLKISPESVVIIPGNHDLNWNHCSAYFSACEGDGEKPQAPFWPKWKHFVSCFQKYYSGHPSATFTESQPWSLFEIPSLRLVVAGLNSTISETHQEGTHFGYVGERQLSWFADKLQNRISDGWLRIAVVHHNIDRGAINDDENLRDRDDLRRILGPHINVALHGHTHEAKASWLEQHTPIYSTGSAALNIEQRPSEVSNQYQIIRVSETGVRRWLRAYDPQNKRWIGDNRLSAKGDAWIQEDVIGFQKVNFSTQKDGVTLRKERLQSSASAIVNITKSLSADDAARKLSKVPRFLPKVLNQHKAIRRTEQRQAIIRLEQTLPIWIIADWGQGKDGFIACTIDSFGGPAAAANTFRLQASGVDNCDDLFACSETQLGLSFQEFAAASAAIPTPVLIIDDISQPLLEGRGNEELQRQIKHIQSFSPSLRIIMIGRQKPSSVVEDSIVELQSLGVTEVGEYLRYHGNDLGSSEIQKHIEDIHAWSGGLPMHLDRLLDRLPYVPLTEILSEDLQPSDGYSEEIPRALKDAVNELESAQEKINIRSWKLLKVLTVLRDGETYQSIRRFYFREPFYQDDIEMLVRLRLIEAVPISQTAPELSIKTRSSDPSETPRLLRVPRQVRDYISLRMTDDERDEIARSSMNLLFGDNWWKGKVRLRTAIANAYGQSAMGGPGNEHVIARHVLAKAIEKGNGALCRKYSELALTYCTRLVSAERYRDASIASRALMDLLRPTKLRREYYEATTLHGKAARMLDDSPDAAKSLEEVISDGKEFITEELREEVLVNLVHCYASAGDENRTRKIATEVLSKAHQNSANAMQCEAVLAKLTLKGDELLTRLEELERNARNHSHRTVANNIALDLADEHRDPTASVEWLNKVITSERDNYNRSRAIVSKAHTLARHVSMSQLTDEEHRLLSAAYSYSYAQRIGALLDRCHSALWSMATKERTPSILLRLFRFSSFIWLLRSDLKQEKNYLDQLRKLDFNAISPAESTGLRIEIIYFETRRANLESSK